MKQTTLEIFEKLFSRRPELADAKESILQAFEAIAETFCHGKKIAVEPYEHLLTEFAEDLARNRMPKIAKEMNQIGRAHV